MATVHQKAVVKSSATFRKRVCPLLHKNIQGAINQLLADHLPQTNGCAVTSDHWTSRAYENYQSMTHHFITAEYKLIKVKSRLEVLPFAIVFKTSFDSVLLELFSKKTHV